MMWLVNFYMAAIAFVMTMIDDAPEQIDHHSWTDDDLDRMRPGSRKLLP